LFGHAFYRQIIAKNDKLYINKSPESYEVIYIRAMPQKKVWIRVKVKALNE
jgi:hypothetical protein